MRIAALGSIVALPVAAEAATLTLTDGGDVLFAAKAGEQNDVDVFFLQNDALMIRDNRAPITASGRCRNTAPARRAAGRPGTCSSRSAPATATTSRK